MKQNNIRSGSAGVNDTIFPFLPSNAPPSSLTLSLPLYIRSPPTSFPSWIFLPPPIFFSPCRRTPDSVYLYPSSQQPLHSTFLPRVSLSMTPVCLTLSVLHCAKKNNNYPAFFSNPRMSNGGNLRYGRWFGQGGGEEDG